MQDATDRNARGPRTAAMAPAVGGLALLAAVVLTYTALALLGVPVPGPPRLQGSPAFVIAGVVQLGLAVLLVLGAVGLFTGRRWGWSVATAANAIALVMTAIRPIAAGHVTPDVIPLIALTGVGLLILLTQPGRARLRRPHG